jgi:hypothetical protein
MLRIFALSPLSSIPYNDSILLRRTSISLILLIFLFVGISSAFAATRTYDRQHAKKLRRYSPKKSCSLKIGTPARYSDDPPYEKNRRFDLQPPHCSLFGHSYVMTPRVCATRDFLRMP